MAGYFIDLVVEGLVNRLAVECDGEAWHGPERFDQDMARQRQLERAGWTFVRVRESEFYADREGAIHRVVEVCEDLGIRPIGEEEREIDQEPRGSSSVGGVLDDEEEQGELGEGEEAPERTGEYQGPAHSTVYSEESAFPDPRYASPANLRAALRRIIQEEGPLTKRFLIKLYVSGCADLHRAGKAVRSLLNRALYSMQKAGEIVVEDELGDRSPESQVLRLANAPRVRERLAGWRDLLEIPPSELFLVLDRLSRPGMKEVQSDETLARELLAHYGFSRLTEVRR